MTAATAPAEALLHDFSAAPPLTTVRAAAMAQFQSRIADAMRGLVMPQVREVVDAEPGVVELLSAKQAAQSVLQPGVRYRCNLGNEAESTAIIHLAPDLAERIVDRLCGGADDVVASGRALTGIELAILGELVVRALPLLADSLRDMIVVKPRDLRPVPAVDVSWLAGEGEHVAMAHLEMRCGPAAGRCTVMLPMQLIADAAPPESGPVSHNDAALVEQHLRAMEVPVVARIGFRIGAVDIATLYEGAVLPTGHPSHGAVEVTVGGRRRFIGMLGREQDHVAVRLLRESTEEETSIRPNRRNQAP